MAAEDDDLTPYLRQRLLQVARLLDKGYRERATLIARQVLYAVERRRRARKRALEKVSRQLRAAARVHRADLEREQARRLLQAPGASL